MAEKATQHISVMASIVYANKPPYTMDVVRKHKDKSCREHVERHSASVRISGVGSISGGHHTSIRISGVGRALHKRKDKWCREHVGSALRERKHGKQCRESTTQA